MVTQFVINLFRGEPIRLVDGGEQKRCFTWLEDGIDGLMAVIADRRGACNGQIFNIGNPGNDLSVKELAEKLIALVKEYPAYRARAEACKIVEVSSGQFYGKGYQDMLTRVPSVKNAKARLGWRPWDIRQLLAGVRRQSERCWPA